MIVSLAELLVLGLIVDWAFRRMTVPGLVGMLFLGVLFGPYVLGWVHPELLAVSGDFRLIALIVILLRAGFELSKDTLNRVGGRVLLLATVPAIVEGAAIMVLGPPLLGLSLMESAILGSILAVAVLSIVLTAPLGAWAISITGDRVLSVAPPEIHDARDAVIESDGTGD